MYSNKYLKAYLVLKDIRQTDIAYLLDKSISTIRRKFEDLGFTQKDILIMHQEYGIPFEAFFYDENDIKNNFEQQNKNNISY